MSLKLYGIRVATNPPVRSVEFNLPDRRAVQFAYDGAHALPYIIIPHGRLGVNKIDRNDLDKFNIEQAYEVAVKQEGAFKFTGISVHYGLYRDAKEPHYAFLLNDQSYILVGVKTHEVYRSPVQGNLSSSIPAPVPFNLYVEYAVNEAKKQFPGALLVGAVGYTNDSEMVNNTYKVVSARYVTVTQWLLPIH
jgi:hypothetical protein